MLQYFDTTGLPPAPPRNFAAMGTVRQTGHRYFAYLSWDNGIGQPGWRWYIDGWDDAGRRQPTQLWGQPNIDLGNVYPVGSPGGIFEFAYEFGRPGSPEQGWVRGAQGWFTGYPVDSYGYPVNADGTPLAPTAPAPQQYPASPTPQQPGQPGRSQTMNNGSLLRNLLVDAPVITELGAYIATSATAIAGAAAITDVNPIVDALLMGVSRFNGVQTYISNLNLASLLDQTNSDDALFILNAAQLGPATQTFNSATATAARDNMNDAIAGATVAVTAPIMGDFVHAFGTFAVQSAGVIGNIAGGANNLALALALGQGAGGISKTLMTQALILGPATTAFNAACDTAKTALVAAALIADVKAAWATWSTAAAAYIAALQQAKLFGAIGS